jgi:phosphoenolpyruvate synthase/pyruvate phosphate dikinase
MSSRISRAERRKQLVELLDREYAIAVREGSLDFTAETIARKAGITLVWFYKVAGDKYQEYCSKLGKLRRSRDQVLNDLKLEVAALKKQIKELKQKLCDVAEQDMNAAITLIEQLELENLALRSEIAGLKRQLSEVEGAQCSILQVKIQGSEQRSFTVLEGGLKSKKSTSSSDDAS